MNRIEGQVFIRQPAAPAGKTPANGSWPGQDFRTILNEKLAGLKFSRHASERLESRQINLSPEQMARLEQGVDKAAVKGARESLVLLDDLALVVSIKNRTVITAATRQELRDNVFTNIDSAVLL
ncbi:TIGR02530 family flagellar biosynthesis protein [Moorella sulfitireducens (nom. illeg.)]|uniref:TIGR02530 family flagellar biosynthesis protein n=1 Tax=Neomoorella sulfitireducens TaxID=2972948 RepID=UPI0021ABE968|nr:TIGR02530 family flagellar biosynthesis protein [Moorella sulfitireducens]